MPGHFFYRVALLVGMMLVVSLVDLYRNRTQAGKYREYGFIIIAGAVGGIVGFVNDLITSSISPDYFILGKGLDDGPDLRMRAGLLGLQVGFSAGVIGGAFCLYASRRKSGYPPAKFSGLLQLLWMPVAGAILCGFAFPLAFSRFDPARFSEQLTPLLTAAKIALFRQVWWTHIGLYAGLVIGLTLMIRRASKDRKLIKTN
jgi:hypothetical protein